MVWIPVRKLFFDLDSLIDIFEKLQIYSRAKTFGFISGWKEQVLKKDGYLYINFSIKNSNQSHPKPD